MPKGEQPAFTIPEAKLCELTGWTGRRLRQLAGEGWFPAPRDSFYQMTPTIIGVIKYLRAQVERKDDSLASERKLLTRAKRETAQLELEIRKKQFVDKNLIGPPLRNVSLHQRAMLIQKLETELAARLPAEYHPFLKQTVDDICAVFEKQIREWLKERSPSPRPSPPGEGEAAN